MSSNSDCPSADAVSVRLNGLLPARGPENAAARVRLDGQTMRIELSTPGEETQERSVPADGDCAARADVAAYVIAAWLDAMPVGTVKAPGIPPREPRPLEPQVHFFDPNSEPLSISTRTVFGAGAFGQVDTLGATAGATILVGMPSLVEQTGWVFAASLTSSRELALGQGTVTLRRPTFTAAVTYDFYRSRRWAIRGQLGVSLGVLMSKGSGYEPDNSATTVMWGLDAGLAVVRRWQRHEWWLQLAGTGWPQDRKAVATVVNSSGVLSKELPTWELQFVLGYSFAVL